MVARIPWVSLLLTSSWMQFWFVWDISQIFELYHTSKGFISYLLLWHVLHSVHKTWLSFLTIYFETKSLYQRPITSLYCLCDTSAVMLNQLMPRKTRVFLPCLVRHTYKRASTSPIICSVMIFQEVGYFKISTLTSPLRNKPSPLSGRCINSRPGKWQ